MCRTAAVCDGPARQTRSVWNLVPSYYGCLLCTSCQVSTSYASARDLSDGIHTTRVGRNPIMSAMPQAVPRVLTLLTESNVSC